MKKLVSASVVLLSVCSGAAVCTPAFAQTSNTGQATATGTGQPANCGAVTIKEPAEYNAYTNAISQSQPAAKAQAIEAFLQQYPNSAAKQSLLEALMAAYQQAGDAAKTLDAAKRLLQVDPNNLRALTFVVYLEHTQANGNQAQLDQAAADAQKGLSAPKDQCMSDADYEKVKDAATPIFYSAIGADSVAKKDYKGAIDAYTKELKSYKDPNQTTQVPALLDTVYLGQAYLQQTPPDLKDAVWFLTRAAQFAKPPYKAQIENTALYWYKKYHCAQNNGACMANPDGYQQIQQAAATPANIFPPSDYNPTPAPPPPSPAELAHQAIAGIPACANATPAPPPTQPNQAGGTPNPADGATTSQNATPPAGPSAAPASTPSSIPAACTDALKNNVALADKEFILANGDPADQAAVWSVMNGVTAQVPGQVVSATPEQVQLAVTQDAQQANKADFTINMKTPLKELPKQGDKVTFIATFDSYTQNPPMIVMKDGEAPAAKKPPVHHAPAHTAPHHTRPHGAR
ncbi:MAG TPA: hypothetical protein VFJ10_09665 [Acidobacteriaceae bacterium]|jgi:hypothetical protein|nr:hypothetical protein [Acidobacteriaceae bacterium]